MTFYTDSIIRFYEGDKVEIRSDYDGSEEDIPEYFTYRMKEKYSGSTLTVSDEGRSRIFDINSYGEIIPFFKKLGICLDGYDTISLRSYNLLDEDNQDTGFAWNIMMFNIIDSVNYNLLELEDADQIDVLYN